MILNFLIGGGKTLEQHRHAEIIFAQVLNGNGSRGVEFLIPLARRGQQTVKKRSSRVRGSGCSGARWGVSPY